MKIQLFILAFIIIGCSSDSSEFPPPNVNQVYRHKTTKEVIIINGVGKGEELKEKADQMDYLMKGKILKGGNAPPVVIIMDPENDDENCVLYFKGLKQIDDIKWHIISVEELASNYVLEVQDAESPEDSIENPGQP